MQTATCSIGLMSPGLFQQSLLQSRHQARDFAVSGSGGCVSVKSQAASFLKDCKPHAVSSLNKVEAKKLTPQAQTQSCLAFGRQALQEVERAGKFVNMQQRCTKAEAEVSRLERAMQDKDAQLQQKDQDIQAVQANLAHEHRIQAQQSEAYHQECSRLKAALCQQTRVAADLKKAYCAQTDKHTEALKKLDTLQIDLEVAQEQVADIHAKMATKVKEAVEKAERDMQEEQGRELTLVKAKMTSKDAEIIKLRLDILGQGPETLNDPAKSATGQAPVHIAGPLEVRIHKTIMAKSPKVEWEQIAGLEDAKAQLQESVVLPLVTPGVFANPLDLWSGILLYGPPGTGKTFLAEAAATAAGCTFFKVSVSDLTCKWVGESEALVRTLFKVAKQKAPSVIFIDEVETLCKARGSENLGVSDAITTELLVCMHDIQQSNREGPQVLVLAATNRPQDIDVAIRRRFQKRFHVPLPDASARCSILQMGLGTHVPDLTEADIQHFPQRTNGMSGSDLANLVNEIHHAGVRDVKNATHFRPIQHEEEEVLVPCQGDEPGAINATVWDLISQGKGKAVRRSPPSRQMAFDRLSIARPSLGSDALSDCHSFDAAFGSH